MRRERPPCSRKAELDDAKEQDYQDSLLTANAATRQMSQRIRGDLGIPHEQAEAYADQMHQLMDATFRVGEGGFPGQDEGSLVAMRQELISPADGSGSLTNLFDYAEPGGHGHGWVPAIKRLVELRRVQRLRAIGRIHVWHDPWDGGILWHGYDDDADGYHLQMNVSDADAVRADWHDRVDQVLAQSAQEWAGVLEVLRGWDNQAVLLASSLPPNAPNQLTPEDLVWTTGEPPPANSYWSQASYVRYAHAFHSPAAGTGPHSEWSEWLPLGTPEGFRWETDPEQHRDGELGGGPSRCVASVRLPQVRLRPGGGRGRPPSWASSGPARRARGGEVSRSVRPRARSLSSSTLTLPTCHQS